MEKERLISIIMAAYNAEKTISEAISSVLSQTYHKYELIVIDDHSTDKTLQVVKTFHDVRIKLITHSQNMGVTQSRHDGVLMAKADWIAILDSDDLWMPEKLEMQVKYLETTRGDFIFTGTSFIHNNGSPVKWVQHVPSQIGYRKLLRHNVIPNSSTLIRKALFMKYEVLDDRVHEDYACWLSMLRDGHIAYGIDKPLLTYRLTTNARTHNKWTSMWMNWRTLRRVGLSFPETCYYMAWYGWHGLRKYGGFWLKEL